ncbi:MAG: hypothetical protein FJ344_07440 [Sphingomonadales bacterium]|nr:hypothetical protein [Sphingomonadales bacterium]
MNKNILKEKASVLSQIILLSHKLYSEGNLTEHQKGLIETLIGAGIWYLPSSTELYSGFISREAYESVIRDPLNTKLVEEHAFPRKVAGHLLYSQKEYFSELTPNGDGLLRLYWEKFGRFNLVLKSENDRLKKYQKKSVFVNEETAYKLAGIELVPFSVEEYVEFKRNQTAYKRNAINR